MHNQFINTHKIINIGDQSWQKADNNGLLNIAVQHGQAPFLQCENGHEFINMCSCSYLGLDVHPKIVQGAISAMEKHGTLLISTSRLRIHLSYIEEVESVLSDLVQAKSITTLSCGSASSGILPVLASGHLTGGIQPLMIFDKNCHFSMNHIKPVCGDETQVLTCAHNDVDFIESQCQKGGPVVYVADGAYSMGGHTPIKELLELQEKYGLYLYFDDSHSFSVIGETGAGFVRSHMDEVSERTIIVASLGKAFGATGGIVMMNEKTNLKLIERFGGPMGWSQSINVAAMGAIMASAEIHKSPELGQLQNKLRQNIKLFDNTINTVNADTPLPIRVVPIPSPEHAIECSKFIFDHGFYSSAVFFPIIARGTAGLRVMPRADLEAKDIERFNQVLNMAREQTFKGR
ncbi:MAG: aminotransferase class I/II-fold pyridoxal phosphate-dependent enzyme [Psychrobium sp.]|nr:aminotransferase class I/II-fold pyridoxal phosphate-dependent enzyme [Psychrobium sp.]